MKPKLPNNNFSGTLLGRRSGFILLAGTMTHVYDLKGLFLYLTKNSMWRIVHSDRCIVHTIIVPLCAFIKMRLFDFWQVLFMKGLDEGWPRYTCLTPLPASSVNKDAVHLWTQVPTCRIVPAYSFILNLTPFSGRLVIPYQFQEIRVSGSNSGEGNFRKDSFRFTELASPSRSLRSMGKSLIMSKVCSCIILSCLVDNGRLRVSFVRTSTMFVCQPVLYLFPVPRFEQGYTTRLYLANW